MFPDCLVRGETILPYPKFYCKGDIPRSPTKSLLVHTPMCCILTITHPALTNMLLSMERLSRRVGPTKSWLSASYWPNPPLNNAVYFFVVQVTTERYLGLGRLGKPCPLPHKPREPARLTLGLGTYLPNFSFTYRFHTYLPSSCGCYPFSCSPFLISDHRSRLFSAADVQLPQDIL